MKESYLIPEFRETVHQRFPEKEAELNAAFEKRIAELRADTAGASKEKRQHLENQILPGIAIYETLQTVMPKEEALQTVHGYVEKRAWRLKGIIQKLMRIPGFYKKSPRHFRKAPAEALWHGDGLLRRDAEAGGEEIRQVPQYKIRAGGYHAARLPRREL